MWAYMLSAVVSLLAPFVSGQLSISLRSARCLGTPMTLVGRPAVPVYHVRQPILL